MAPAKTAKIPASGENTLLYLSTTLPSGLKRLFAAERKLLRPQWQD